MYIDEYITIIKKEFYYLFEECEYKIVFAQEKQQQVVVFRIGIQSNVCKILFVREQGGGVIFLGHPNASFENEISDMWVSLVGALNYTMQKEFDWTFLENIPDRQKRRRAYLAFLARQFKPYCKQLTKTFHTEEKIKAWKIGYKTYIRKKR